MENLGNEFMSIRRALYRRISRIVPIKDAEDIVQDVYIRAAQKTDEIEQPKSFMFKTAQNLALDYIKRAGNRLTDQDSDSCEEFSDGDDPTFHTVAKSREFTEICKAIAELPPKSRKAFVLKRVYGYSQREIAEEMNISENTVQQHIAKGLRHCKAINKNKSTPLPQAHERSTDE